MNDTAIRVQGLGKRYRIVAVQKDNRRLSIPARMFSSFDYISRVLREPNEEETLWALRDVSFEVKQGEVLGIIGRNGAGKSTLLKLVSRITQPTSGKIELYGRVGSMLEVGTGFHPDLTGRENIYVNGAVMGMTPEEIKRKFDEIVDFSGVEKFLDTMVKYYSSGMYVRLAFAVAAQLEPEILVIDEVLAVGDAEFQKKCLGKMDDITKGGRTILFVSHNMVAIRSLCHNTILLKDGKIALSGPTDEVVDTYLKSGDSKTLEQKWDDPDKAPGNETVRIHRIWIANTRENKENKLVRSSPIEVGVEYWNLAGANLSVTLHFLVEDSFIAFSSDSPDSSRFNGFLKGTANLIQNICVVPANLLNSGIYHINVLIIKNGNIKAFALKYALTFEVLDIETRDHGWFGKEPGVVTPVLDWETKVIES